MSRSTSSMTSLLGNVFLFFAYACTCISLHQLGKVSANSDYYSLGSDHCSSVDTWTIDVDTQPYVSIVSSWGDYSCSGSCIAISGSSSIKWISRTFDVTEYAGLQAAMSVGVSGISSWVDNFMYFRYTCGNGYSSKQTWRPSSYLDFDGAWSYDWFSLDSGGCNAIGVTYITFQFGFDGLSSSSLAVVDYILLRGQVATSIPTEQPTTPTTEPTNKPTNQPTPTPKPTSPPAVKKTESSSSFMPDTTTIITVALAIGLVLCLTVLVKINSQRRRQKQETEKELEHGVAQQLQATSAGGRDRNRPPPAQNGRTAERVVKVARVARAVHQVASAAPAAVGGGDHRHSFSLSF